MVQTKAELKRAKCRIVAQTDHAEETHGVTALSPRHQKILEIIRARPMVTRQELASRLSDCGFPATPLSVLFDLVKLGLKKQHDRWVIPRNVSAGAPVTETHMAFQDAQVAAQRLPLRLRRELAERLLASIASKQKSVTVHLRTLPRSKQSRLEKLLDKNTDGKLTKTERAELQKLGKEVDEAMLSNSLALARAARPELFDERGRLIKSRFQQTYGSVSTRVKGSRREPGTR